MRDIPKFPPDPAFQPERMRAASDDASELMKSLGNPHRLMILCQLIRGEQSVGQLAEFLGIRDSTVSQHLALLRRERIVAGRRDGQTIWYRVESPVVRDLLRVLYDSFCGDAEPPSDTARDPRHANGLARGARPPGNGGPGPVSRQG